ncbi:MAG: fasciclin domain-containing protein [Phycisphaeraceae bacterium]|nr:fasciclin domain-containing protein [Phycisphaeraceae bacterium]
MNNVLSMVGVVALCAGLAVAGDTKAASCGVSEPAAASMGVMAGDIVETAVAAGQFKTLVAAVQAAGLVETLKGKGPFTVFAPTDEAFAKLPKGTVESLLLPENKAKLAAILTYHVVPARVVAADVKAGAVATANGQRFDVRVQDGKVTVDNANVVKTDILCSNGVIHVIDTVILPSDNDIVDTAVAAGQFKTLAMLLDRAGLVEALKGDGPFTVFAPTDDAFAKLPKETVESLLKSENKETLASILKFHVIPGRVFSDTAAKGASVATLQGQKVTTKSEGGKVLVQNATVLGADIDSTNGVIHVIDTVILPPAGK